MEISPRLQSGIFTFVKKFIFYHLLILVSRIVKFPLRSCNVLWNPQCYKWSFIAGQTKVAWLLFYIEHSFNEWPLLFCHFVYTFSLWIINPSIFFCIFVQSVWKHFWYQNRYNQSSRHVNEWKVCRSFCHTEGCSVCGESSPLPQLQFISKIFP